MLSVRRGLFGLLALSALGGCASLNYVHDPQTGVINRDEVPRFLKSVRCELSTFYHSNLIRRTFFEERTAEAERAGRQGNLARAELLRDEAVRRGVHFPVAPDLFGGVYMDLKVVDTVGIGAGDGNFVNKRVIDPTHTETYSVSPVLNTQNTYQMVYSFLIDQSAGISRTLLDDPFKCYNSALLGPNVTPIMLAEDAVPQAAQYTRILVNAQRPLAAWLLDNAEQIWVNFHAKRANDESERLIPVQMNYSFTVQVTAGLNARYSLTAPIWTPAQIGGGAGSSQTSQMAIYLNGEDANLAGGAKLGSAVNKLGHRPGTRRFVANPEHLALKAELSKTTAELATVKAQRDEKALQPQATEGLDKQILDLNARQKQLEQRLKTTPSQRSVVVPAGSVGRSGNYRGYLNSPIGIAPPQN